MIKSFYPFLFFSFVSYISYSQNITYKHYTAENGLPHDITYQIIQDKSGYIWVGTDDGLAKFNGEKFIIYTLENGLHSNFVIDIFEKKTNHFLVATWGGGVHELKNDSISLIKQENLKVTKIKKVYQLNDSLIYGNFNNSFYIYNTTQNTKKIGTVINDLITETPLVVYNRTSRTPPNYYFNEMIVNDSLFLFCGENKKVPKGVIPLHGVFIFNGSTLKRQNYTELNSKRIHAISLVNDYFFASSYNEVFVYDKFKNLVDKKKISIKNESIIQLQMINQSLFFVSLNYENNTRKLYKYDWNNNYLTNISKELGINSLVSDFLFDRDKNLWVTTYGKGVYYIPKKTNSFYGKNVFNNPDLKDILIHNESLIVLAPNKIYNLTDDLIIDEKNISVHSENLQLIDKNKLRVIVANPPITNRDVFNEKKIIYESTKSFTFEKESGTYYFMSNYLKINDKNSKKTDSTCITNISNIKKAVTYKNSIIAIYGKGGIFEINTSSQKKIAEWNKIKKENTVAFNDIIVQKDTIWVATNRGLFKVTPSTTNQYTTKNGLVSNHINNLHVDNHGALWIATQKGLNVYAKNTFIEIGKSLGQYSSFVTKITSFNDYIYATGNKGLFKTDNLHPVIPKSNTKLLISHEKSVFVFNAINYLNHESVVIEYQLNNDKWVKTLNKKIDFQNHKQGVYVIQFRYKDSYSSWKYSKKYQFKITYPWHQQNWFYILITFILLGSVCFLLFLVLKKSLKKNKKLVQTILEKEQLQNNLKEVRKNVARDFHDELGNKLASISITSNLLTDDLYNKSSESKKKKLYQIKKDADYLYNGVKDFIWSLDHKNDDLHQLQIYLNDFGENLFENSNIAFYSSHNFKSQKTILPFYWSKQLVLIFKEAMTNVLIHSNATKVHLNFLCDRKKLIVTLKDDGEGFVMQKLKRINGIKNMKFRANSLEQQLLFETTNGVTVQFIGNLNIDKNV